MYNVIVLLPLYALTRDHAPPLVVSACDGLADLLLVDCRLSAVELKSVRGFAGWVFLLFLAIFWLFEFFR